MSETPITDWFSELPDYFSPSSKVVSSKLCLKLEQENKQLRSALYRAESLLFKIYGDPNITEEYKAEIIGLISENKKCWS